MIARACSRRASCSGRRGGGWNIFLTPRATSQGFCGLEQPFAISRAKRRPSAGKRRVTTGRFLGGSPADLRRWSKEPSRRENNFLTIADRPRKSAAAWASGEFEVTRTGRARARGHHHARLDRSRRPVIVSRLRLSTRAFVAASFEPRAFTFPLRVSARRRSLVAIPERAAADSAALTSTTRAGSASSGGRE